MDELAAKTEKVKVLSVKLNQENRQIDELKSEKTVMKSCVEYLNSLLSNIIKIHDTLIPLTMKKHLADKLRPAFAMLNRLEGVSESTALSKQGGETTKDKSMKEQTPMAAGTSGETEKHKSTNEPKGNVPSSSK